MQIQVNVAKETYDFGNGLIDFISAVKQALSDGWQPLGDVPAIVIAAVKNLGPTITHIDQLSDEYKQTEEFDNAVGLIAAKLTTTLRK